MARIHEIQKNGTPDIEFAAVGLLCRSQLASGRADDARHTLELMRTLFVQQGQKRFLPNIDAMLCRIALQTGDRDTAETWYRENAPRDPQRLNVMKRYQYLTQAMAELAAGRPDAALLTLAPLRPYCQIWQRHIDGIHLDMLCAIALYRQNDRAWQERLTAALDAAEAFFLRPDHQHIRQRGAPPAGGASVGQRRQMGQPPYGRRAGAGVLLSGVLTAAHAAGEELTAAELHVLRLICADKSNAEIGTILHIKLPAVKTHVRHILAKLNVSRRSEAKAAAKTLRLISENL